MQRNCHSDFRGCSPRDPPSEPPGEKEFFSWGGVEMLAGAWLCHALGRRAAGQGHIPIWSSEGARSRLPSELLITWPAGSWGPGTILCLFYLDHVLPAPPGPWSSQRESLDSAATLRPEHQGWGESGQGSRPFLPPQPHTELEIQLAQDYQWQLPAGAFVAGAPCLGAKLGNCPAVRISSPTSSHPPSAYKGG